MTTKELLETLNNCKFCQDYIKATQQKPIEEPIEKELPKVNWNERKIMKNRILVKYLKIFGVIVLVSIIFLISPLWLASAPYGKGAMLSIPPMLFMSLTWLLSAWWAWDKDKYLFFCITMGGIPVRLVFGGIWAIIIVKMPGINLEIFVTFLMLFWVIFSIPEIAMLIEFSNKLPRHGNQEEPNGI
jgi:hypothetical protein